MTKFYQVTSCSGGIIYVSYLKENFNLDFYHIKSGNTGLKIVWDHGLVNRCNRLLVKNMTLLSLYQSISDQFMSNLIGANYKIEYLVVLSPCGKQENQINIFVLGMDQDGCRLSCDVWWLLKMVEGQNLRVQT